jgi:hypothetical protein
MASTTEIKVFSGCILLDFLGDGCTLKRVILMPYPTLKRQEEHNPTFLCTTAYFNVTEAVVLYYSKDFFTFYVTLLRVSGIDFTHTQVLVVFRSRQGKTTSQRK